MGLDQRQEQHDKDVKGEGGAIGLTEDEDKLSRWMVCGTERQSKILKSRLYYVNEMQLTIFVIMRKHRVYRSDSSLMFVRCQSISQKWVTIFC